MKPILITKFAQMYVDNNKGEKLNDVIARLKDAVKRKKDGAVCQHCGQPIWAAGSFVVGNGCFTCITGEADDSDDYEIDEVCFKMKQGKKSKRQKAERKSNVVQFLDNKENLGYFDEEEFEADDFDDEEFEDDFEDWEVDSEYIEKEDWEGLIKYREQKCRQTPEDPYAEWRLGEAYYLNDEYERALQYFTGLYKKYPDFDDVRISILETLYVLGKNENDFDWLEKPIVLSLTSEIMDKCYDFLKAEKIPWSIYDIFDEVSTCGDYLKFDMEALLEALKKDQRFVITDGIFDEEVSVKKK